MIVAVRVKPNSRKPRVETSEDGGLVVHVRSAPVEGKANEELIERVAAHYRVPKSRVRIRSGAASRVKLVEVDA
jgi:uncharacterized protein (TIGR00251 family)